VRRLAVRLRHRLLRACQPCPLSGKPDIEPTPPNDRV
jgi:hypothetical protein